LSARLVLIIGEDELKKGVVTLKDMVSGEQREVNHDESVNYLKVLLQKG
jgi:histidyl-tRNA synthetase